MSPFRFASFRSEGNRVSRISNLRRLEPGTERKLRHWKEKREEERRDQERNVARRKCRSGRNWGGGWRATGTHAAPRRPASLNIRPPFSLFESSLSPTTLSVARQPTRRQAAFFIASNSNLRSPLERHPFGGGCYGLCVIRGVPRKVRRGNVGLVNARAVEERGEVIKVGN